jgi:hypothetical protein
MNPLMQIAEAFGISVGPIEWFFLTILGYFLLGFGGMSFDITCNRFRNSGNGQFVKWEFALLFGGLIELVIIFALKDTMGFFDLLSSLVAWIICIGLTILLGLNTRAATRWI